jgi:hypothetical protein
MRISCLHGFFRFYEDYPGECSEFADLYGFDLVFENDYFTFETLSDADDYSIVGKTFCGAIATKNYAGLPWEIMRENSLVYNFNLDQVVPIATITTIAKILFAGSSYSFDGLVMPGSLLSDGSRIKDYSARFSLYLSKYNYSWVNNE